MSVPDAWFSPDQVQPWYACYTSDEKQSRAGKPSSKLSLHSGPSRGSVSPGLFITEHFDFRTSIPEQPCEIISVQENSFASDVEAALPMVL